VRLPGDVISAGGAYVAALHTSEMFVAFAQIPNAHLSSMAGTLTANPVGAPRNRCRSHECRNYTTKQVGNRKSFSQKDSRIVLGDIGIGC
jgi:hypothetical protein